MSIEHPAPWTLERRENPGAPCPVYWHVVDGDGYKVLTEEDEETAREIVQAVSDLWAYRHNESEADAYIHFLKEERALLLCLVKKLIPAAEWYARSGGCVNQGARHMLLEEVRRVVAQGGYWRFKGETVRAGEVQ